MSQPWKTVPGARKQSLPSVRISKKKNRAGEHELTITIVREGPLVLNRGERRQVRLGELANPGGPLPEPLFKAKLNADRDGYDIYITLLNDNDQVTIGRPQSQGTRGSS